jgi:2-dehydropantoate 2-reductase
MHCVRVIIFGAGAVGSILGGRLHQGGADVMLVARPAHVEAINTYGLRLRMASHTDIIDVPAVTSVDELHPGDDDVVIITAKTQDTPAIHDALLAWNPSVAVVCGTNGVEHERMALRRFERVYGMVIQMPSQFEKPGEVTALFSPNNALVDVGRFPSGVDGTTSTLAAMIEASPRLSCQPDADVMAQKYAKLLLNLGNAADAACGRDGRNAQVVAVAIAEGRRVLDAAGIRYRQIGEMRQKMRDRMATMQFDIPIGDTFLGGSTWQSLAKGATTLETDYFNGEINLLGRMHGMATPANLFLQQLATRMLHERSQPGTRSTADLDGEYFGTYDASATSTRVSE